MQLKVFSIRDSKTEIFNKPFYSITAGEAERSFQTLVNDPQSAVFNYPEDYDLYLLGDYDDVTGKLSALQTPQHVIKAVQVKKTVN